MAAFDFPNSPSVNDTYSANGMTFTWNGTKWERTSPSVGAQGATGPTGPTGSTGAQGATAAQGAQGATGSTGAQGATGPTGAQGAAGAQGATAAAGAQGASGSATLSNNADNRVITGGSGTNLNGEANFTYDGDIATITRSANAAGGLSIINTNNSQASAHARLELSAGDNSSAIFRMECNGHSNELIADGSGNFRIDDNGTERLRIDASGSLLVANTTGSRTNLSGNADDIVIGNTSTSNETGISMFSTNASGIRFNDASGTDGAIEYAHSARELRFNSAGANRLQFGINASSSPVFSFGTGHYSGDANNHNKGDRASVKVGAYLHLESALGAGHNSRAGLGYNCYFHSLEDFYCGSRSPSSGDNRPAAYGMAYGNHYFYSDASNTAHSAQASLTMSKMMEINRNGRVKFGTNLFHQLHSQTFSMYPDNGANHITRLTFTGLQFGTYIAQIGYYNAAGQGYGGGCFHVSGYQTASYTYNVKEIERWDNASNSAISAVMKYNSSWVIDITNSHGSYTGAGEVAVYGDAQVSCTISYHT